MAKADPFRPFDPEQVLEDLLGRSVRSPEMLEWQVPFGKYKGTWSYEDLARTPWGRKYLEWLHQVPTNKEVVSTWVEAKNEVLAARGRPPRYEVEFHPKGQLKWKDTKTGKLVTWKDIPPGERPFNVTPNVRRAVGEALRAAGAISTVERARGGLENPRQALGRWLYHVTPTENLAGIRRRGLVPSARQYVDPAFFATPRTMRMIPGRLSRGRQGPMFSLGGPEVSRLPAYKHKHGALSTLEYLLAEASEMRRYPSEREYRKVARKEDVRGLRRQVRARGFGPLAALRTTPEQVASKIPREELLRLLLGEGVQGEIQLRGRIHPKKLELLRPIGRGRMGWGPLALLVLASTLGASFLTGEEAAA